MIGRALREREDGSILPLVFGFFAVALALVLVATAATSLFVERSRLYTLADGAALAGAETFDAAGLSAESGGEVVPQLDSEEVRHGASVYLDAATAGRSTPVALVWAGTRDGRSATVRLAEQWRPPVVSAFVPAGVRIEVEAASRPVFW
ncbi:pilus assembly protein TadG-related protein [Gryllotalpicola ginsengisoli]|uniref:pilus assembly protein TadG-related protein n=1 Tax=Gryllotalpicola ginsengisoli TaxID=444608 RepID=UPI0003B43D9C|nr:pilus assembly protein TadG-related protein [Gryllotalpicola ginsengisoli]